MTVERDDRVAGGLLVLAALMAVLTMAHHPTHLAPGSNGLNLLVHGTMIVLVMVTGLGFARFAVQLGMARLTVLGGAIAYAVAMAANIGAATINGFAVPALARQIPKDGTTQSVFLFAWDLNQALAGLAVYAVGAAFLLWSLALVPRRSWDARALAALGIAGGLVPVALLGFGAVRMNVAGAMLVYVLQAGWVALAGLYLWSGRLAADRG